MTESERQKLFNDLYTQYEKRIFAYCVYVTGDKDQASDIFQEVFIKAYRSLHTIRESSKAANWLFRIARNECLNSLKVSQRNERRKVDIDDSYESEKLASPPVEYTDEFEVLKWALTQISEEQREALLLAEFEGFSLKEIADMTGATLSNVKVRIHRAKNKLQKILQPILNSNE
jgi:RNA polymerase sigma-70 factor, ECF subfamily